MSLLLINLITLQNNVKKQSTTLPCNLFLPRRQPPPPFSNLVTRMHTSQLQITIYYHTIQKMYVFNTKRDTTQPRVRPKISISPSSTVLLMLSSSQPDQTCINYIIIFIKPFFFIKPS